eukprot:821709_1
MDAANKPYATFLWVLYKASDWKLFDKMIGNYGIDLYDSDYQCCSTALHAVCNDQELSLGESVALTEKLLDKATMRYLKAFNHAGKSLFMLMAHMEEDRFVIMDLIWQKFNDLCEKETNQEDEKEESHLLTYTNDERIKYLNVITPQGIGRHIDRAWNEGVHAMQLAVERGNHPFLRTFLSLYPTSDSKRDIISRTDLPRYTSFLLGCAEMNQMECWDVLWKEIEELCNDDDNRHEIVMNYLKAQ